MIEYDKGETVCIDLETMDENDVLTDVVSVGIEITDPAGTSVSTGTAARGGTGRYTYSYLVPATAGNGDIYSVKATITNGSNNITIKRAQFRIR